MSLVDLNVLLYALDRTSAHHERARRWVETALSGTAPVAFAWVVLLGFMRLSTKAAAFRSPLTVAEALTVVSGWLERPNARVVEPTPAHLRVLGELLETVGTGGNLTTDAHLAALSIEHGATVITFDHDFARFGSVRWELPDQV